MNIDFVLKDCGVTYPLFSQLMPIFGGFFCVGVDLIALLETAYK